MGLPTKSTIGAVWKYIPIVRHLQTIGANCKGGVSLGGYGCQMKPPRCVLCIRKQVVFHKRQYILSYWIEWDKKCSRSPSISPLSPPQTHSCTKLQEYIIYIYLSTTDTHTPTQCPPDLSVAHNYLATLTDRVRATIDPRHWNLTLYLHTDTHAHMKDGGVGLPQRHNKYKCVGKAHLPPPIYIFLFLPPPRGNIHAANKGQSLRWR